MKEQRTRDLFEALGELDSTMLERAYAVDSAEKLQSLCDAEAERRGNWGRMRPAFRRAAVVCACLAIVFGMVLTLPSVFKGGGILEDFPILSPDGNEEPSPGMNGELPTLGWEDILANAKGEIVINNLDKLNYYAAKYLAAEAWGASMQRVQPTLIPLVQTDGNVGYDSDVGYDVDTPPVEDVPPEEQSPVLGDRLPSQGNSGIVDEYWVGDRVVYYGLEPTDRYTIDAVLRFQIELADPQGYLAARIGTGIVDVVVTSNNLEPMITFRNGDRFYSCLVSGGGNGKMIFSTHKYIEGFYIVKNLEQDNFSFTLTVDEGGVRSLECRRYKSGASKEEQIHTPDAITLLPREGDGVWYQVSGSFSVGELQQYYDALDAQKGDLS